MKRLSKYLVWAFAAAWILQIAAGLLFRNGYRIGYSALLSLSMFAPLLATAISGYGLRQLGWKPRLRKNLRWLLIAWFLPIVLGTIGAAIYFFVTPDAWDTTFSYAGEALGAEGIRQLEANGLSLKQYAVISAIAALTYAPFINMLLTIGEEVGWRGTMYPELKARFGETKGRVLGGIVWGVWHWPIMLLAGYEYGTTYWGAPITGPLLFCVITVAMGILLDFLYGKTASIWVPALCHGAINAFAGVPILFLKPAYADQLLLGPLMVGLIGGLPLIMTAVIICIYEKRKVRETGNEE